ncbi:2-hydroxyacid dehydrogenase [Streptomyces spiroverticillatus]|uniref:2-hydroxyacid dehydrogenase n=1 Tax=Streptomyces finlayi TaxID=67296 RepID=A0A919C6Z4_9ACTN|nr:hydroxyacid dehydrogenase [Streptomyces finlayi]GGZ88567.1 2-hydroxyacid dehydrogenase [Streptomyces spiroverticillatus]GHC79557.1 2-hydroxyacid dehydrogenase [Streptomyces finlayi]
MHHATDNRPATAPDRGPAADRPRTLLAMAPDIADRLFTEEQRTRLARIARTDPHLIADDLHSPAYATALARTEVLLTCWGATPLTAEVLERAPRLRAVVHAAGSVKHHVTQACWDRGITVSAAAGANALPVAEYTLAAILLAGKQVARAARRYRELNGTPHDWRTDLAASGNYRRTVGIVGASRIGRRVIELLRPFDVHVLLYDPYVSGAEAARLGVTPTDLGTLCARSSVVSVHAPQLPETRHLIGAAELAAMQDGATLINTSRGSLVDEAALLEQLRTGRLDAVLDVTDPELPPPGSPFYTLPNVLLTPHMAGSFGNELHRMAAHALDELERYGAGLPFVEEVRPDGLERSA